MNRYFYLVHVFIPNIVCVQIPIYILADSSESAQDCAKTFVTALSGQFNILLRPSDPLLLIEANKPWFDGFMTELAKSTKIVTINLPHAFNAFFVQDSTSTAPLSSLKGRVLVPGQHSSHYSL